MAGCCGLSAFILLAVALWAHSILLIVCALALWLAAVYLDKKYPMKELQ